MILMETRGRVLVCWPAEDGRTSGCRFSAVSFDPGKEERFSLYRDGVGPDLAHPTCFSPAHPTVDGQLILIWGKELVRERGVTFHFFKALIYILTSNLLPVPQIQLKSLQAP